MDDFTKLLEKYADTVLKVGVNLQKDQTLIIRALIENREFVHLLVKKAYLLGAKNVVVDYTDEALSKLKVDLAPQESLDQAPNHVYDYYVKLAHDGAAFLSILANDPDLYKESDSSRVAQVNKANAIAMQAFRKCITDGLVHWNIVAAASPNWAKKVFPALSEAQAMEALWQDIFKISRIEGDNPILNWQAHLDTLTKHLNYLNSEKFTKLHYKSSNGTDLMVELPEGHIWLGGGLTSLVSHKMFVPNMPTEEVFTLPKKHGVNGIVYGSKPLNYGGSMIENYYFVFENGKVKEYWAEVGQDALKNMISLDENASFLGEVALVPFHSPISNLNRVFYNILIDENASCHFAVGTAYPMCLENGTSMSKETLESHDVNVSIQHIDFMIGTKDMSITAFKADGSEVLLFKEGDFNY